MYAVHALSLTQVQGRNQQFCNQSWLSFGKQLWNILCKLGSFAIRHSHLSFSHEKLIEGSVFLFRQQSHGQCWKQFMILAKGLQSETVSQVLL